MVLLPCSKCCGPCWRCYEFGGCDGLIYYWAKVVPDGWQDAFRLSGNSLDTDTQPPSTQGNPEPPTRIVWRPDSSSMFAEYSIGSTNTISFQIANLVSDEPGLILNVFACIEKGGEKIYELQLAPSNKFPVNDKFSVKHTATDGSETVWDDLDKQVGLILPLPINEDSVFFTGKYTASYVDGNSYSVELRNIYQLINNLSTAYDYQCLDAPPEEEGWQPVGGTHADEATCQAACPSVPFCECDAPNVLGNELTVILQDVKDAGYTPTDPDVINCTPEEFLERITALHLTLHL